MPYKMQIPELWVKQRPKLATTPHFYNLDESVGVGCPNKRLDVMLVQVLIVTVFDARHYPLESMRRPDGTYGQSGFISRFHPGANTKQITVLPYPTLNGVWSNKTLGWVLWCQMNFFVNDSAITGKINPIRSDISALNDPTHTLFALNARIRTIYPKLFSNLAGAPGIPGDLAQALKNGRAQAG